MTADSARMSDVVRSSYHLSIDFLSRNHCRFVAICNGFKPLTQLNTVK